MHDAIYKKEQKYQQSGPKSKKLCRGRKVTAYQLFAQTKTLQKLSILNGENNHGQRESDHEPQAGDYEK